MEFIDILNDYALMKMCEAEQFHTYIYDGFEIYYGEIFEIADEIYIEFITDKTSPWLGLAVFKFFECKDKTELSEIMPSVVNFIKFVKSSLFKMEEYIDNESIKKKDLIKFQNLLEKDSNLILIGAYEFLRRYMSYYYINII